MADNMRSMEKFDVTEIVGPSGEAGGVDVIEDPDGDYVRYADVISLLMDIDRFKKDNRELRQDKQRLDFLQELVDSGCGGGRVIMSFDTCGGFLIEDDCHGVESIREVIDWNKEEIESWI